MPIVIAEGGPRDGQPVLRCANHQSLSETHLPVEMDGTIMDRLFVQRIAAGSRVGGDGALPTNPARTDK
jgi:hypothetical protein